MNIDYLHPRYQVIADYPGSIFNIGDVLHIFETVEECDNFSHSEEGHKPRLNSYRQWQMYPAIFRPLIWWEKLAPEEFPGFVRFTKDFYDVKAGVYKVDKFEYEKYSDEDTSAARPTMWIGDTGHLIDIGDLPIVPATELEYSDHVNKF